MNEAEIGRPYLLMLAFNLAYVGRLVRLSGLTGAVMEQVSNVHDTHGGNNWGRIAAGLDREQVDYRHFGPGESVFPAVIAAHPWAGELPAVILETPPAASRSRRRT